jgi:hypothetical protein
MKIEMTGLNVEIFTIKFEENHFTLCEITVTPRNTQILSDVTRNL